MFVVRIIIESKAAELIRAVVNLIRVVDCVICKECPSVDVGYIRLPKKGAFLACPKWSELCFTANVPHAGFTSSRGAVDVVSPGSNCPANTPDASKSKMSFLVVHKLDFPHLLNFLRY